VSVADMVVGFSGGSLRLPAGAAWKTLPEA
jgi:hypothetical protein